MTQTPTDALRLVPIDMQIESILHDLVEEVSAAQRGARVKARARQCCARGAAKNALLNLLAAAPASPLPGGLPPISLDGPHTPSRNRQWLARQLLDSKLDDDEAYGIVRHHPAISLPAAPTGDA